MIPSFWIEINLVLQRKCFPTCIFASLYRKYDDIGTRYFTTYLESPPPFMLPVQNSCQHLNFWFCHDHYFHFFQATGNPANGLCVSPGLHRLWQPLLSLKIAPLPHGHDLGDWVIDRRPLRSLRRRLSYRVQLPESLRTTVVEGTWLCNF